VLKYILLLVTWAGGAIMLLYSKHSCVTLLASKLGLGYFDTHRWNFKTLINKLLPAKVNQIATRFQVTVTAMHAASQPADNPSPLRNC